MKKILFLPERASGAVNKEFNVFRRVLGVQQKQLANNSVGNKVINIIPQENNPFSEK